MGTEPHWHSWLSAHTCPLFSFFTVKVGNCFNLNKKCSFGELPMLFHTSKFISKGHTVISRERWKLCGTRDQDSWLGTWPRLKRKRRVEGGQGTATAPVSSVLGLKSGDPWTERGSRGMNQDGDPAPDLNS